MLALTVSSELVDDSRFLWWLSLITLSSTMGNRSCLAPSEGLRAWPFFRKMAGWGTDWKTRTLSLVFFFQFHKLKAIFQFNIHNFILYTRFLLCQNLDVIFYSKKLYPILHKLITSIYFCTICAAWLSAVYYSIQEYYGPECICLRVNLLTFKTW